MSASTPDDRRWRALVVLGFAGFVLVLATSLLHRIPDISSQSLSPLTLPRGTDILFLPAVTSRDGVFTRSIELHTGAATLLVAADEIQLRMTTTPDRGVRLISGAWDIAGCRYLADGSELGVTGTVTFRRTTGCTSPEKPEATGTLLVRVTGGTSGRAPLGLWMVGVPDSERLVLFAVRDGARLSAMGRATAALGGPAVRRVELLAFVWDLRVETVVTLCVLFTACGFAGSLLLPAGAKPLLDQRGFVIRAAASASLLTISVAGSYALVIPPLQAPDEPAHLMTYVQLRRSGWSEEVKALAERTHFDRIRFHSEERFLPSSRHGASPVANWPANESAVGYLDRRSATTFYFWRWLQARLPSAKAVEALLSLRLFDALAFGLMVGGTVTVFAAATRVPFPQLLWVPVLFVPAVPFFATAVSNYSVVTWFAVLLGAGLLAFCLDAAAPILVSSAIVLSLVVLTASTQSSFSLAPLALAVIACRLLLGAEPRRRSTSLRFWIPAAAGLALWPLITTDRYQAEAAGLIAIRAPQLTPLLTALDTQGWLLFVLVAILVALELVVAPSVARSEALRRLGRAVGNSVPVVIAVTVCASLVASLFVPMPTAPGIETQPMPLGNYVMAVCAAAVSYARIGSPDFLLATSFWGTIGWLDAHFPPWMVTGGLLLAASGIVVGAVGLKRSANTRRQVLSTAVGVGLLGSVALYAAASHSMGRNLHARYMIPVYVTVLILAFAPILYGGAASASAARRIALVTGLFWLWHAAATASVLHRYF